MNLALKPLQVAGLAATALAAVAGVWLLRHFDPNVAHGLFPTCMFRDFTGWYCIGCGMTRMLHALVHGDLPGALAMNPLGVLMLPLMALMVAWSQGWQPRVLRPLMDVAMEPKLWLWVLPGYWVARNLPWLPFTLLAPG